MRIAEYKQIDTKTIEETITTVALDENGIPTGEEHEQIVTKEVPVMGMVYRDMTEEEVRAYEEEQANIPPIEPTQEDRIEAQVLYTALLTDTLLEEGEF